MYNKVYNSTVYYANHEPQLRSLTKDGKSNQFVNIMSIYGKAIIITPARNVCNKYDVCFELNHANNWLAKRGLSVRIPENLNFAISMKWDIRLGKALADTWDKYLADNINKGYLVKYPNIDSSSIKHAIEKDLNKYGLSYNQFLDN